MSLSTVRTYLQSFTGEMDFSDAELNLFIQQGQLMLDHFCDVSRGIRKSVSLSSGGYSYDFTTAKTIESLRFVDSGGVVSSPLRFLNINDFENRYPDLANEATGDPVYWAEDVSQSSLGIKVLIAPPTDETITLKAIGTFEVDALSDDADTNIWSEKYTDMLIMAARCKIDESNNDLESLEKRFKVLSTMIDKLNSLEGIRAVERYKDIVV